MKRFFKRLLGLGILLFGVAVAALLWVTRPEAEKKDDLKTLPVTKVMEIEKKDVTFTVPSQGIIEADRRTLIAAEVAGRVEYVSKNFKAGRTVIKGDVLIRINPIDYESAVAQARSTLEDAKSVLATEEARAKQAKSDWENLRREGEASELVQRIPQLRSALARLEAAEAALKRAKADEGRTILTAPYDAVIASTMTEFGNYLTPGASVAEVFATSPYEVRLPLSVDEARFLQTNSKGSPEGRVVLSATAGGIRRTWNAKIVRSEGEIDRSTRSLYVVAEVGTSNGAEGVELRPGLFTKALIEGQIWPDVTAIPFAAFRDLDTVVVVDPDNQIQFRDVTVIRREDDTVYVSKGLSPTDRISLTEMPDLVIGMEVKPELVPSPLSSPDREQDPKTTVTPEP